MLSLLATFRRRWHLVEECDDNNLAAGDGCSPTCLVEPGWACPLLGACARLPAAETAAAPAAAGLIYLTPLAGAGGRFGWMDMVAVADASRAGANNASGPDPAVHGIYKWGAAVEGSNDLSSLSQAAAAAAEGDAFVCACGGGLAGRPAGLVVDPAGRVGGAEGVFVRDGVDCRWEFPFGSVLRVGLLACGG
jgi:cysteine-rich repeat protein